MARGNPKLTPYFVYGATILLDIACIFSTSALLWPWGTIVLSALNLLTMIILIQTSLSDGAMDQLLEKRKMGFKPEPYVPAGDGTHVIHNEYCRICLIKAPKGTKHCRQCNVCIEKFDHHCTWLNMCVGGKNYQMFLTLVVAVVVTSGFNGFMHMLMLILWFLRSPRIAHLDESNLHLQLPFFDVWVFTWIGFSALIFTICMFIFFPTLNLLIFHINIAKKGKSTYQYVMEKRNQMMRQKDTVSGTSTVTLSEVRVIGAPHRSVRDLPPVVAPRIMETGEGRGVSPRFRNTKEGLPNHISQ